MRKQIAVLILALAGPGCPTGGAGDSGGGGALYGDLTFQNSPATAHSNTVYLFGEILYLDDRTPAQVTWTNDAGPAGTGGDRFRTFNAGAGDALVPITVHEWFATVDLVPGTNVITVTVTDGSGGVARNHTTIVRGADLPAVVIAGPTSTSTSSVTLTGTASSALGLASVVWQNDATGATGTADGTASWSALVPLVEGPNNVRIRATDVSGGVGSASITVTFTVPVLTITLTSPSTTGTWTTSSDHVRVFWSVTNDVGELNVYCVCVESGFYPLVAGPVEVWSVDVPLVPGLNTCTFTALDSTNARSTATLVVTRTP